VTTGPNGTVTVTQNTPNTLTPGGGVSVGTCDSVKTRLTCLEYFLPQSDPTAASRYQASCGQQQGTFGAPGTCPSSNTVGKCTVILGGSGISVTYYGNTNVASMRASCVSQNGTWQ
jgi:hypothetical protein